MMRATSKSSKAVKPAARKSSGSKAGAASRAAKVDARVAKADEFLLPTYKRAPFVLTHGRGCYVFDTDGKKYLDFLGGIAVNALGHAHPRIVKTIRREAARAIHFSNLYHHPFQGPLAEKLSQWSGMDHVFFSNSGSEAIEGALKLARLYGRSADEAPNAPAKKYRVLAMTNSFHGRTMGAVSATSTEKYRLPFAPLVPGIEFVRFNDVHDLESKFDDTVCAVPLEPIQGEGGIHSVSEAFWNRARALTAENGAVLIADEIQCGLGRTDSRFGCGRGEDQPGATRLDLWRWSARLRDGARVSQRGRERKASAKRARSRRGTPRRTYGARQEVRFHPRSARRRPDDRRRTVGRRRAVRHRGHESRAVDELHARFYSSPPAAVHRHQGAGARFSEVV